MSQSRFSDLVYSVKKKRTRKEIFLQQMDQILPWSILLTPIKRHYPNAGKGRLPIDPEVMLRIYFMQQWYGLNDPAMEDSLCDIASMRGFVKVTIDSIPDEATICRCRHLLERHRLTEKLFVTMQSYFSDHELILSEGTIVDASIISAPSSTKNKERKRDPEMTSTKKGKQWYFTMTVHVGTDKQAVCTVWR